MTLEDQRSDRSRRALIGIARRLADADLARRVLEAGLAEPSQEMPLQPAERDGAERLYAWPEKRLFPLGTAADVLLSRIYFEAQRGRLTPEEAARISGRMDAHEMLHGLHPAVRFKEPVPLEAEPVHELLPGVRAAGKEELKIAAEDFSAHGDCLSPPDRETFACNVMAAAESLGLTTDEWDAPPALRVYAGQAPPLEAELLREHLGLRKAAAMRRGLDGAAYDKLALALDAVKLDAAAPEDLRKLARTLHKLDAEHGLADRRAARRLPDAWAVVFGGQTTPGAPEKAAVPEPAAPDAGELARRFGPGALEEVTNPDGSLNPERVAAVMRLFGGVTARAEGRDGA